MGEGAFVGAREMRKLQHDHRPQGCRGDPMPIQSPQICVRHALNELPMFVEENICSQCLFQYLNGVEGGRPHAL